MHAPFVFANSRQFQALEFKQRLGHRPALVLRADKVVQRHLHLVEKDFVEDVPAMKAADRSHLDARGFHVDQQKADALLRLGLIVGAHQAEHPVGVLRTAGPDLGAVDHVVISAPQRAGGQRGQVGAGIGLGIALAPPLPARRNAWQEGGLLRGIAKADQHRPDHVEGDRVELGRVVCAHLLLEGQTLHHIPAVPTVLERPVRHQPALSMQHAMPAQGLLFVQRHALAHALAHVVGQLRLQKSAHLLAKAVQVGRVLHSGESCQRGPGRACRLRARSLGGS